MNELLATLIASVFGTGGIAGIAALTNRRGSHRLHKNIEQLSSAEQYFDNDESPRNSLIASKRITATEMAVNSLIKYNLGDLLLALSMLALYISFLVILPVVFHNDGEGLFGYIYDYQQILPVIILLFVVPIAIYLILTILVVRIRRRRLQSLLLSEELSVDELMHVVKALQGHRSVLLRGGSRHPELILWTFREENEKQSRLF